MPTSQQTAHHSAATKPAKRHLRKRVSLAGTLAAIALCLGTSSASADVRLAGVTFHSTVVCSTSVDELTVMTGSNAGSGSWAMVYLYDYQTGRWIHENQWHNVSGFPVEIAGAFNFVGHHYYRVWIRYAQATSAGWTYSGETPQPYYERNANGYGTHASNTCFI